MFVAPIAETETQKHDDCHIQDQIGKMYLKLQTEGYFGDYNDYLTAKYEEDIHKMYVGTLTGDNTKKQCFDALRTFYEYYKTKANKIDPDAASLEYVRERMSNAK